MEKLKERIRTEGRVLPGNIINCLLYTSTRRHMHLTHAPSIAIDAVEEAPSPISKVVFSAPEEQMHALYAYCLLYTSWWTRCLPSRNTPAIP